MRKWLALPIPLPPQTKISTLAKSPHSDALVLSFLINSNPYFYSLNMLERGITGSLNSREISSMLLTKCFIAFLPRWLWASWSGRPIASFLPSLFYLFFSCRSSWASQHESFHHPFYLHQALSSKSFISDVTTDHGTDLYWVPCSHHDQYPHSQLEGTSAPEQH